MPTEFTPESLEQRLELLSCTGLRLVAFHRGKVAVDFCVGKDGMGRPLGDDALHAIYCAGKPLLALTMGSLVSDGEASWDDQLGWLIESGPDGAELHPSVAKATLAHVMSHSAGLSTHKAEAMTVLTVPERKKAAMTTAPVMRRRGYGEFQGWTLLALAVEALTGKGFEREVEARVIRPLGLAGELFARFDTESYRAELDRLAINVDHRHRPALPLLAERSEWMATDWNPAYGVYATASGLASLYETIRRSLAEDSTALGGAAGTGEISAEVIRTQTSAAWKARDHGMGRDCGYGLGFMTALDDHDVSQHCSESSFGHTGIAGMTLGFCDPVHELSVAVMFNGMTDARTSTQFRRPIVIDALYRHLLPDI